MNLSKFINCSNKSWEWTKSPCAGSNCIGGFCILVVIEKERANEVREKIVI